jgi:small subunit ribosomal protein S6
LRVTEPVIKFITVRMDEETKRIDKVKAIRATRQKRSDQAPAESAEPAAAEPAPVAEAEAETEAAKA